MSGTTVRTIDARAQWEEAFRASRLRSAEFTSLSSTTSAAAFGGRMYLADKHRGIHVLSIDEPGGATTAPVRQGGPGVRWRAGAG